MNHLLFLLAFFLTFNSMTAFAEEKLSDFFKLVFYTEDSVLGFHPDPDSIPANAEFSGFASNMYGFNQFLYANYSKAQNQQEYLMSLLPDSNRIKKEHAALLNEDKYFRDIFLAALTKRKVADIALDSLQVIASRFFFVHRSEDGQVLRHVCVGINGVLDLQQTAGSPYYNAFCWMAVRNFDSTFELFDNAIAPFKDEIMGLIDDKRLDEIKTHVFNQLATDAELKQAILNELEQKKEFLNFKILKH